MSSDPHDELARRRAERHRNRGRLAGRQPTTPAGQPTQKAAIARARESWLLSRDSRDEADESNAVRSDCPCAPANLTGC